MDGGSPLKLHTSQTTKHFQQQQSPHTSHPGLSKSLARFARNHRNPQTFPENTGNLNFWQVIWNSLNSHLTQIQEDAVSPSNCNLWITLYKTTGDASETVAEVPNS
eukprot:TRINITY_DN67516_c14_g3_i1.p1 TRINITY_DN67516_c14_g3~~TRINITY_DN67516_c14_g3_i1.p1  ORF type:complete len:106 (+),score=5.96 TRINITY_DN67516_c14_g3_i1:559-876(+)